MSFGEELRRERELRQITLREISESTKISLRYLEALESNEFKELPGGVFNRGFVRAYAQFIGVDPEGMVNAYLLEEQAQAGQAPTERHLLRRVAGRPAAKGRSEARARSGWLRRGLLVLILLVIATGLYFVLRWAAGGSLRGGDRSLQDQARWRVTSTAVGVRAAGTGEDRG